jgi:hypothetical protein
MERLYARCPDCLYTWSFTGYKWRDIGGYNARNTSNCPRCKGTNGVSDEERWRREFDAYMANTRDGE